MPWISSTKIMHHRRYSFDGDRRADGLWDVEGHLTDTKT